MSDAENPRSEVEIIRVSGKIPIQKNKNIF